ITWCVVSNDEMTKCNQMSAAFQSIGVSVLVQCVSGKSMDGCVRMVKDNTADAFTVDGGHLLDNRADLKPVLAEDYGNGDATYWAVAVVKKSDKSVNLTSAGLGGKKSCHTGYGKTAGWKVPMGVLKSLSEYSACTTSCDIPQAVSNLFSQSCVPGSPNSPNLCTQCPNSCDCSSSNANYCGYTGAFRCLVDGGDVAFIKHTTVFSNTNGANQATWAQGLVSSDYELLCQDGTRAAVTAYAQCNMGKVPSHAVVVSQKATSATIDRVLKFGPHTSLSFKLFGGSPRDLLFKSSTKLLLPLNTSCSTETYLGASYLKSQLALKCLSTTQSPTLVSTLRWCVLSANEMAKCSVVATQARRVSSELVFSCVMGSDINDCARRISLGTADAVTMDGGHIYSTGVQYDLQPVATEYYGSGSAASYYAVAVVKASDSSTLLTKAGLQGKKSCHTGYQRTAGWNVPVGYLVDNNFLTFNNQSCSIPEAVSNFFSGSCAPGAKGAFPGAVGTKLCQICGGVGANHCDGNNDPYSGYSGAISCLNAGGDVAFVKHTTVLNNATYKLICPNGGTAPTTDYMSCNIATVPSHAVMLSPKHTLITNKPYMTLLNPPFLFQQNAQNFQLFSSTPYSNGKDLMFKDSTRCLWKVDSSCVWQDYLGAGYLGTARGLQ
uniref:Transferrin-like domain-containing protein n=1 Tax=Ciona savignyi TaxID=51511 RepID=H2YUB7_CIOSA